MKKERSYHLLGRSHDSLQFTSMTQSKPRCIENTFYGLLREDLLARIANKLHETNNLVRTFVTLEDLMDSNKIPEDLKLVIHAHERTNPDHERKYNIPEASEFAALIAGEQYGAQDIVLRL